MPEEIKQEENKQEENKPRCPPATKYHVAVIQCDFTEQMGVYRYIMQDSQYIVVAALHDKDIYTAEEIKAHSGNDSGVYVRKNPDGTESEFRAGDCKPAHIHMLIQTRAKIRSSSLTSRFSRQVHFQPASDRWEYARYLLHRTYTAKDKYQYQESALAFSDASMVDSAAWYKELVCAEDDILISTLGGCIVSAQDSECRGLSRREMIAELVQSGDVDALKSIMSHSHFYDKFIFN